MKSNILFALTLASVLGTHQSHAQDANSQVKVKVKDLKLAQQTTPDYTLKSATTEKRWRPKQWLEFDTELDVDVARDLGGREGTFPSLDLKFFVALNAKNKEGKNIVLTGTLTVENVPASRGGDHAHALAYITPATLKSVLKKDLVGKTDVVAVGLEVHAGGQMLQGAFYSDKGQPWWVGADKQPDATKFEFQDGGVLPKSKTPFAPLWADYDLQTKSSQ